MGLSVTKPTFNAVYERLNKLSRIRWEGILHSYGRAGVDALSSATPVDTGETAASWGYEVQRTGDKYKLIWTNSSAAGQTKTPLVILLEYGHGTGTGGYVPPKPFINAALQPIFDSLESALVEEVRKR